MPSNTARWKYPRSSPYECFPARTTAPAFRKEASCPPRTIGIRALLVSADIQTIDTLCHYMGKLAMHVDVCSDFTSATRKLCHAKYEAIVVDFKEAAAALDLLKKSREMTSHKAAVVIAILNGNDEMPSRVPRWRQFCSRQTDISDGAGANAQSVLSAHGERTQALLSLSRADPGACLRRFPS